MNIQIKKNWEKKAYILGKKNKSFGKKKPKLDFPGKKKLLLGKKNLLLGKKNYFWEKKTTFWEKKPFFLGKKNFTLIIIIFIICDNLLLFVYYIKIGYINLYINIMNSVYKNLSDIPGEIG